MYRWIHEKKIKAKRWSRRYGITSRPKKSKMEGNDYDQGVGVIICVLSAAISALLKAYESPEYGFEGVNKDVLI